MTDIIDTIDDVLDTDVGNYDAGEYEIAYLQGDYERCPRCGRHWHGLPITERIAAMYARGQYDPDYELAEDTSQILCEGSDFIGPLRPPPATLINQVSRIQMRVHVLGIHEFTEALRQMAEQARPTIRLLDQRTETLLVSGYIGPQWQIRGHHAELFQLDEWFPPTPEKWWREHCTPTPDIEFGQQWWHHEVGAHWRRAEHALTHFPRNPVIRTPLEHAVASLWDLIAVEIIPTPERPGYDFTDIIAELEQPTTGPSHAATNTNNRTTRTTPQRPHQHQRRARRRA